MAIPSTVCGSLTRLLQSGRNIGKSYPGLPVLRERPRGHPSRHFTQTQTRRTGMSRHGFATSASSGSSLVEQVEQKNATTPVIVYSKTYCPYCSQVKTLFKDIGVQSTVIELDNLADGADVQSALGEITKRSTVPQVFIGGKFVGGCDDTMAAYKSGKLQTLLKEAGVASSL